MTAIAGLNAGLPPTLLSRVEDAGLNASAPPQQRWLDGWLVRLSPGKAKRARCVNAVAEGRLPLNERLALAREAYAAAGLPLFVRITPFSQPPQLDAELALRGFHSFDDTRVMVCPKPTEVAASAASLPPGLVLRSLEAGAFAELVGALRGSPAEQRAAHAERLCSSPVPYRGFALFRGREALACGQIALENELAGLYDVFTAVHVRDIGLAPALCTALLAQAVAQGANTVYLQVEGDNAPARAVYRRLRFVDAYRYHYRSEAPGSS